MAALRTLAARIMAIDTLDAILALGPVMLLVCGFARWAAA